MTKHDKKERFEVSRRQILAGAGLTFGIAAAGGAGMLSGVGGAKAAKEAEPNAWVTINPDDTVIIRYVSAEMGQGVATGLPLVVAEELDADWSKVRVEVAPPDMAVPQKKGTWGNPGYFGLLVTAASSSTRSYFMKLRMAGAQARKVLLNNAAQRWKVKASELTTENGTIIHQKSGRRMRYGDVAKFAKMPKQAPKVSPKDLKNPKDFRLIGKDVVKRWDVPLKVTGQAKYASDVQIPHMIFAAVLHPPVRAPFPHKGFGQKPDMKKTDLSEAKKVPGVINIVPTPFGIAVLAKKPEIAFKAKSLIKAVWQKGTAKAEGYDSEKAIIQFGKDAENLSKKAVTQFKFGDARKEISGADKVVKATYYSDHVNHAPMEPMTATARVDKDLKGVDIWIGTQTPSWSMFAARAVLGLKPEEFHKIRIHQQLLGGGFGRRVETDITAEAVGISKAVTAKIKKPAAVKVVWSREDDVQNDTYRPMTAQHMQVGVDKDGNILGWHTRLAADSIYARLRPDAYKEAGGKDAPVMVGTRAHYPAKGFLSEYIREDIGIPVGVWRGVSEGYTKFAMESMVDDIAASIGKDPLAYRKQLLKGNERAQKVLDEVAKMADYDRERPNGRAIGIAYQDFPSPFVQWEDNTTPKKKNPPFAFENSVTHVAAIAEISVGDDGVIKVHKFWSAVDPGQVVMPKHVEAQIEGSILYSLGSALRETITFKDGTVQQSNFHDYQPMRMAEVPEVEVKIISTPNPPGGIGEASIGVTGAAVSNAFRTLTGKRLNRMPMNADQVKKALG